MTEESEHRLDHFAVDDFARLPSVLRPRKFDLLAHQLGLEFGEGLCRDVSADQLLRAERPPCLDVFTPAVRLGRFVREPLARIVKRLPREPEFVGKLLDPADPSPACLVGFKLGERLSLGRGQRLAGLELLGDVGDVRLCQKFSR